MRKRILSMVMAAALVFCAGPFAAAKNEPFQPGHGKFVGSFIQAWWFRTFTAEDWDAQLSEMQKLGMKYLILQSTFGTDYSTIDALGICLRSAKAHDMQIILGLSEDDGRYSYESRADSAEDIAAAKAAIRAIWSTYGTEYGETVYGWYFTYEFNTSLLLSAKKIGQHMKGYVDAIKEITPDKPLVFSPYIYLGLGARTPLFYGCFLRRLFREANLRPVDVFMPQDSYGTVTGLESYNKTIASFMLPIYIRAEQCAAKKSGIRFWINNEAFQFLEGELCPIAVSRLVKQYEVTNPYAQMHFIFSWNHYYGRPEHAALNEDFKKMFATGYAQ